MGRSKRKVRREKGKGQSHAIPWRAPPAHALTVLCLLLTENSMTRDDPNPDLTEPTTAP